jgi:hypothetical protein
MADLNDETTKNRFVKTVILFAKNGDSMSQNNNPNDRRSPNPLLPPHP